MGRVNFDKFIPGDGRVACVILCLSLALATAANSLELTAARQKEVVHMVRQDCGACHGLTLQGGLGPPLIPSALRDKNEETLSTIILYGRPGTPMPPFHGILDETETRWIAHRLLTGFPQESR